MVVDCDLSVLISLQRKQNNAGDGAGDPVMTLGF